MKLAFLTVASNLVALACVLFAGKLCLEGKEGWGWFLFIALLTSCWYRTGDKKNE